MRRSARPANATSSFIAPIQQRLSEFEIRFKKWRLFSNRRSSSATRTGAVVDTVSSTEVKQRKERPVCFTAPIPRKTYYENMGERRRRPDLNPDGWGERPPATKDEINEKYKLIEKNSGILTIGGTRYKDVKTSQIKVLAVLGSGTCGTVHRVRFKDRVMAEKEMKRTDNKDETKRIFMDLDVIRKSNNLCPFIVQCYGYIITEDYLKIYMELMASCAEKLLAEREYAGFPEEIIGKITIGVTKALIFLKDELSLMHRDIKPSNILLNLLGDVKLCDFGISGQLIDSNAASMSAGCIGYLAPERIRQEPYNAQADVWSLGITLVHLAWGVFPYHSISDGGISPFELMVRIRDSAPPKLLKEQGFSDMFIDFVNKCLNTDAKSRPRFSKLLELEFLQHAEQSTIKVDHWLTHQDEYNPRPNKRAPSADEQKMEM